MGIKKNGKYLTLRQITMGKLRTANTASLIVAGVLVFLTLSISRYMYLFQQAMVIEEQLSRMDRETAILASDISNRFSTLALAITATAKHIEQEALVVKPGLLLGELRPYLFELTRNLPTIRTIVVIDPAGIITDDLRTGQPAVGVDVHDREYFIQHKTTTIPGVSIDDPVISRIDGKWTWPFSVATRDEDGNLLAVVLSSVDVRYFGNTIERPVSARELETLIIHENGRVLQSTGQDESAMAPVVSEHSVLKLIQSEGSVLTESAVDPFGRPDSMISATKVSQWPIMVVMRLNRSVVHDSLAGQRLIITLSTLAVCLMIFGATWYQFRYIRQRDLIEQQGKRHREQLESQVSDRTSELKASQDELVQAAEIAKLGHWRVDEVSNEYLTISAEYARIFGYTVGEFVDRYANFEKDMELKHPDDREMAKKAYDLRGDIELDYRILRRDGEVRYVRETCTYIPDENGNIIESVGTLQDITELKVIQLQAEEANRAKSEFLSSMSHELRTPMNSVLGFAEILNYNPEEPLTEKQKFAVDHILRSGKHLLELIDQVLELSRIEAGKLSIDIEAIPARDVIDKSLHLIQTWAKQEGIKILDQTVGDDLPLLWTDKTRLTQVLLNLLSNAVKYNCKDGTVTLSGLETPGQMFRISIADTGMGIYTEQQDDLFKPFERLGRETGQIEGTGIGLIITKQIIELLGGQVGFESEHGKGSTFWIDIPINKKQTESQKIPKVSEA